MVLADEQAFWARVLRRSGRLLTLRIRRWIVLELEALCEFLDDLPTISRIRDPEHLGSLWRVQKGRYGCRWFDLVGRSKRLDALWSTECWNNE